MDTIESDAFEFSEIVQKYIESREMGLTKRPRSHVGIESAHVRCKACGHEWDSYEHGLGSFKAVIASGGGRHEFRCPSCGVEEMVPSGKLMKP